MPHRILIVDDHNLFRQGLRSLLASHTDFDVVGEAVDGKAAVSETLTLRPDIVLMDIALPGMNGLEVTAHIKRRRPELRVVLLTAFKSSEYLRDALNVGADGYLLKAASCDDLLVALRTVASGKRYMCPEVSDWLVDGFLHPDQPARRDSPLERLTRQERSILQLVAEGRTNRSVADFLSISTKTVEKHRSRLMQKLGLRHASELILVALELGLIERPGSVSRLVGVFHA